MWGSVNKLSSMFLPGDMTSNGDSTTDATDAADPWNPVTKEKFER